MIILLLFIVSDTAEVKGRVVDPFFDRVSQTMKQIEIPIEDRGRTYVEFLLVK